MFSTPAARHASPQSTFALRWLSLWHPHKTESRVEQAHTQRRLHDHHPDAAFHDAGCPREDATGLGCHQDALPFFLQSGFGRR